MIFEVFVIFSIVINHAASNTQICLTKDEVKTEMELLKKLVTLSIKSVNKEMKMLRSDTKMILDEIMELKNETLKKDNSAEINGPMIYLIGGRINGTVSDNVLMISPIEKQWKFGPKLLEARERHAVAVIDRKIYVIGGYNAESNYGWPMSSMEFYDPEVGFWQPAKGMQSGRKELAAVAVNDIIYACGGLLSGSDAPIAICEAYDSDKNLWTYIEGMKEARLKFQMIEFQEYIYAIGGGTRSVERYDLINGYWTFVRPMSNIRGGHAATVHNGMIFVAGGWWGGANTVEVYFPQFDDWESLEPMLEKRNFFGLVTWAPDELLAIGGFAEGKALNSSSVFHISSARWVVRPELELPVSSYHFATVYLEKSDNWNYSHN